MEEICIAVAEWAKGPTTWVPSRPGGDGTGAGRDAGGTPGRPMPALRRSGAVDGWG
ncbi:hypothetical protein GCM10010327_34760 [Streptomyces nitrosporeus]|nr:hypothetical protein GCM10010327_34760 [Streptomyces nitrosporeus]